MSYQNIRDTREGFVNSGAGDRLIKIESRIVAIVVIILMLTYFNMRIIPSLIVGAVIGLVFPWMVGLIEFFAWIATIIFSIIWAIIGYFLCGAICGPAVGIIAAIIIAIVSFFLHKIFAGLGYTSVEKHALDTWDKTQEDTAHIKNSANYFQDSKESNINNIKYCQKCGAALDIDAKFCARCGSSQ